MKKNVLFILFLFAIANMAYSQIDFGVKMGLNSSYMHYVKANNSNHLLGFSGGLMSKYQINNTWEITGELLYSQRGYTENNMYINDKAGDLTVKFYALDVPILARIKFYKGANIQLGALSGVSLGNSAKFGNQNANDQIGKPNTFHFGLAGGVGYEFNNGLLFDFRYIQNLTHTYKSVSEGFQIRTFELSVGYKINWNK